MTAHAEHAATLRDYLHVLRRRKWIVLQAVVLVPAAAIAFSLHQQKLYQASAQVLLSTQNLAAELTGTQQTGVQVDPTRVAQTQADVARVPTVAAAALRAVPYARLSPLGLLDTSSVSTATNADILTFEVTNHNPVLAELLVNAYARAYTRYRHQLDTSALHAALANVDGRIKRLVEAGGARSSLYSSLVDRQQTLATMSALQTSNASVVQEADKAVQTQPKTSRNTILGILLGLVLGVGLAYAYVAYRVGDGPDAEDVTSETFERALRYRESFDPRRGEPVTWLIGIARRCIVDAALGREVPTDEPPERAVEGHEEDAVRRLELAAALASLDERDRELVALRYGSDLTARQIGELLDMRTNAVEVALHRALARLRTQLEASDNETSEATELKWTPRPQD